VVEVHLRALETLLDEVVFRRDPDAVLTCRHFFSGAAAYAEGRIFMTLTTVGLALKLPETARILLIEDGAKPLRYFPDGPVKKDYVVLPRRLAGDPQALGPWVEESIAFVMALPKTKER
jgi:TfoX/Sxy family transcriptional regulator of competence genes